MRGSTVVVVAGAAAVVAAAVWLASGRKTAPQDQVPAPRAGSGQSKGSRQVEQAAAWGNLVSGFLQQGAAAYSAYNSRQGSTGPSAAPSQPTGPRQVYSI